MMNVFGSEMARRLRCTTCARGLLLISSPSFRSTFWQLLSGSAARILCHDLPTLCFFHCLARQLFLHTCARQHYTWCKRAVNVRSDLETLRILKIVKILRLVKMLRMVRISGIFAKWESSIEIDYRRLSLLKFALVFIFASHWMACLWHITTVIESIAGVAPDWVEFYRHLDSERPLNLYIAALYWCASAACVCAIVKCNSLRGL